MKPFIDSNFCSVDFTLGSLILIAKKDNSEFSIIKEKFKNSENFINVLLDFFNQNNIKIENLDFLMINLGPGGFVGLRNILSSLKSISLVKKIKILGFNNFQILKTLVNNKKYDSVAVEVNNKFYVKKITDCGDYHSQFALHSHSDVDTDKIAKFSELPKYSSKNLLHILDNKLFIDSKLFPIYENK
jgi:tRNA A37 threonylcarbamoyladenosine modification protein TsaB